MNNKYPLLIICCLLFFQCANRPKVAYVIPPGYPEERKKELVEVLNKGQELYKTYCSGCHGIFTKGKDNIPNFSTTQLDNYSSRFLRRDAKSHEVLSDMSQDQLNKILTFLRFKKTTKPDSVATKHG